MNITQNETIYIEKFLDVISQNDPFSELMCNLYGGEKNYFHNEIRKILENYFDKKNKYVKKTFKQKLISKIKTKIFQFNKE